MIKVLIVDDDPMVADINKRFISSVDGFEVVGIVNDGATAIGFCRKTNVDLAILDIFMPRMDGLHLLGEMRRRFPNIDVIFVTASKEMKHIDEGMKLGAVDYLIKPFEYERLRQSLEKYRDRFKWMERNKEVDQKDLDQYMTWSFGNRTQVRKGLHEKTLMRLRNYLDTKKRIGLSSDMIADDLHMSKVTIRRYLEYLEEVGEVKKEMVYGTVGRPSYEYYRV